MRPPLSRTSFDLGDVLWVMHCAEAPVPRPSIDAAHAFLQKELRPWELSSDEWAHCADEARAEAASMLGGRASDVTLTSSTSAGLITVAQGLTWRPGDEVVAPLGEFPSNIWPWKALASRGVTFREVPLWPGHKAGHDALESTPPPPDVDPEATLLAALGPRTRVLTVSWARFQDGLLLELQRLAQGCAQRGVALVVDGIQAIGTVPLDLEGVAAFATGVQKGLLAPQGSGFLWTHPSFRRELAPLGSWLCVEAGQDFRRPSTDHERAWVEDGRKLELGGLNPLAFAVLARSLQLINQATVPAIHAHVRSLQARLLEGLYRIPAFTREAERLGRLSARGRLTSLLGIHHEGRGARWLSRLLDAGLARRIYATQREGYLRLALHGWHDESDVARLLEWLGEPGLTSNPS